MHTDHKTSNSSGKLLAAITLFAALAPGVLMMAPALAGQLASAWRLSPAHIGMLFSAELGGMSLATLPAWWWMNRVNWRRVAVIATSIFILGNLVSALIAAWTVNYPVLLLLRFVTSLSGGTLMILCITCAASTANPSRAYAFWMFGQLTLGALGLLLLPVLFAHFGLMIIYLILAILMVCCLPLLRAFPVRFQANVAESVPREPTSNGKKCCAVLAVLAFYISISAVWTFMGTIAAGAGLDIALRGQILATASVFGIIATGVASLVGHRIRANRLIWLGYGLLAASLLMLSDSPMMMRFSVGAMMFIFAWNFGVPFILARVAALDNNGKLMNSINLVIGGGMAIGPALAGDFLQFSAGRISILPIGSLIFCMVSLALLPSLTFSTD